METQTQSVSLQLATLHDQVAVLHATQQATLELCATQAELIQKLQFDMADVLGIMRLHGVHPELIAEEIRDGSVNIHSTTKESDR